MRELFLLLNPTTAEADAPVACKEGGMFRSFSILWSSQLCLVCWAPFTPAKLPKRLLVTFRFAFLLLLLPQWKRPDSLEEFWKHLRLLPGIGGHKCTSQLLFLHLFSSGYWGLFYYVPEHSVRPASSFPMLGDQSILWGKVNLSHQGWDNVSSLFFPMHDLFICSRNEYLFRSVMSS